MSLQSIVNETAHLAHVALEAVKTGVSWAGHKITTGYSLYAIPAAKKVSDLASIGFKLLQNLMKSGPGFIFALAGSLLLVGITAFKLADRKASEDDVLVKTAWKTVGIVAIISATALSSLGIYTLV
jgi:hypothetical protein